MCDINEYWGKCRRESLLHKVGSSWQEHPSYQRMSVNQPGGLRKQSHAYKELVALKNNACLNICLWKSFQNCQAMGLHLSSRYFLVHLHDKSTFVRFELMSPGQKTNVLIIQSCGHISNDAKIPS